MTRRGLGSSGVAVDALGFGAVPLGNLYRAMPEAEAAATVAIRSASSRRSACSMPTA